MNNECIYICSIRTDRPVDPQAIIDHIMVKGVLTKEIVAVSVHGDVEGVDAAHPYGGQVETMISGAK